MKHSDKHIWYYIKSYKFNSLFIKNLMVFVLLIVLPISIIGYTLLQVTGDVVSKEINNTNTSALYRVKDVCDTVIKDMERLATNTSIQDIVQLFMFASEADVLKEPNIQNRISNYIKQYTFVYKHIDSIYVYSEKSKILVTNNGNSSFEEFRDKGWFEYYNNMDTPFFIHSYKKYGEYPYLISIIRPVYFKSNNKIGAIVVNINAEELSKLLISKDNPVTHKIFLVGSDERIVYSNDISNITKAITEIDGLANTKSDNIKVNNKINVDGDLSVISVLDSNHYKWEYISITPLNYYKDKIDKMRNFIINIIIIFILVGVIVSFIISLKSFTPISNIISVIDNPTEWENEQEIKGINSSELKYIIGNIVRTVSTNKEMVKELESKILSLNTAQVAALQAQINPHFLYNTLETINWMVISGAYSADEISTCISDLSDVFEASLDMEGYLVKVEDEVEYTKKYLRILQIRYRGKFDVEWNIDKDILDYKIIKMSLQPIVENAVYHGIKPKESSSKLVISGYRNEDIIIISIADDGVGMSGEILDELRNAINDDFTVKKEHVGLRNVNQRIKLVNGIEYGLEITSVLDKGTTVKINIPLVK